MKYQPLVFGTALLFSSALFVYSETSYGKEATIPGKYKMTYEIDGKIKTVTVEVKPDQTELLLKDLIIGSNEKWSPLDNIVSLKDKDGEPLELKKVTIKHNVNPYQAGIYFVKFLYKSHVSVAKVSVHSFIRSDYTQRVAHYNPESPTQTKIILNDELLKEASVRQKKSADISGGAASPNFTSFGSLLSNLSGTLLYGTRRV